jgi:hypothetical protein
MGAWLEQRFPRRMQTAGSRNHEYNSSRPTSVHRPRSPFEKFAVTCACLCTTADNNVKAKRAKLTLNNIIMAMKRIIHIPQKKLKFVKKGQGSIASKLQSFSRSTIHE